VLKVDMYSRSLSAAGEFGGAVNVCTLTTHSGFIRMAVTAPERTRRRGTKVKRISPREMRRMRTCFGRVEEILRGRKRLVGRFDGGTLLELIIT